MVNDDLKMTSRIAFYAGYGFKTGQSFEDEDLAEAFELWWDEYESNYLGGREPSPDPYEGMLEKKK